MKRTSCYFVAFAIVFIVSNILGLDSKSSYVISPFFLISKTLAEDGYTKWNPPEYKTTKGKEIYNQDGLRIIEYEDGRKVTTNDNERWDEKTEYPDGRIVTEFLNGPTVTKQPDGSIVTDDGSESYTDYPDGTRVRKYHGAGSDDDIALKRVTERPDGTVTNEFSDGTRDEFNGFGKTTLTSEHGGMRETRNYPEGAWVKENADGTTVTKLPNGQTVTEWPDRTRITENPDDSRIVQNPDGTRAYDDPNTGKTSYEKPIVTKTEDGETITKYRDGTTVVEDAWGKTTTTYPDGTKVTESPDHEKIPGLGRFISYPGGKTIEVLDDGTKRIHFADGTQITEYPDGRVEKINPDGTLAEREDGNVANEINELDNQYKETRSKIDRLKEEKKRCKDDHCRKQVQEKIKKAIARAAKTINKKSRLKKEGQEHIQEQNKVVSPKSGKEEVEQSGGIIGAMRKVQKKVQESANNAEKNGKESGGEEDDDTDTGKGIMDEIDELDKQIRKKDDEFRKVRKALNNLKRERGTCAGDADCIDKIDNKIEKKMAEAGRLTEERRNLTDKRREKAEEVESEGGEVPDEPSRIKTPSIGKLFNQDSNTLKYKVI